MILTFRELIRLLAGGSRNYEKQPSDRVRGFLLVKVPMISRTHL